MNEDERGMPSGASPSLGVGVLGTGVPRLACLRPAAWLEWGPNVAHLHQHKSQDPREGPSLARRTTWSFLQHGLLRLAPEEAERSRWGTSRVAHDASRDDQRCQAGASPRSVLPFLFGAKGASAGEKVKQRHPFRCNETKTNSTTRRKSLWIPSRRHHQNLWQGKTNFSQDKCSRCSPSNRPIVGALPAQIFGKRPRAFAYK